MQYALLFIPVVFSAGAQILVKWAAQFEIKTVNWFIFIGLSMASYVAAFVLYSFTVRQFPINIASPVNTIAVMVIVFLAGYLMGEAVSARQLLGIVFGLIAIVLIVIK
ncbi:MAG: EamA family transporter [Candidatus Doudnabacteria bacterium]|nr:EamA family transporter [Candidatus Doudnabacteria bacterium]